MQVANRRWTCSGARYVLAALSFCVAASFSLAQGPNEGELSAGPAGEPTMAEGTPPPGEIALPGNDVEEAKRSNLPSGLVEIVRSLEWWIIPFAIATLISLWFTTERLVVLRRGRVIPKPFVNRFLQRLEGQDLTPEEALEACEENGSPIALIFAHGVRKWGKPSVEVEQAIIDGGERQVATLRRHLRVLHGVATVTPLIGLLGTVWGMFEAFNDIAAAGAMGRTEVLAGGIALALLTTAAGLVVAIPSLIVYMYLAGRVDTLVMQMDELAQRVVNIVSAEGLEELDPPKRKKAAG